MWFHSFLWNWTVSPAVPRCPEYKILMFFPPPIWPNFTFEPFLQSCVSLTVPWLFFFSTQMWLLGFTPQKKEIKIALRVIACFTGIYFKPHGGNKWKTLHNICHNRRSSARRGPQRGPRTGVNDVCFCVLFWPQLAFVELRFFSNQAWCAEQKYT